MAKTVKPKIDGMPWNFAALMNESIRCFPQRPMVRRDNIWASELGGDFCSRYLKMFAHPYTNPPNDRSRRKFISGDIFEWIVYLVLTSCGILKAKQLRGEVQLPGQLKVTGRLDFIAGGDVDWDKAKAEAKRVQEFFAVVVAEMPPIVFHSIDRIIFRMQEMFTRVPLKEIILECKAVSGFVSDLIERTQKPRPGHPFQNLHYVMANKIDGALLYINKDSFLCHQFDVLPTKELVKQYKDDVATMTGYFNASGKNYLKNLPPKEPEAFFDEMTFKFLKNNHVEYSPYLTMLYGYADFDAFKQVWEKSLLSWNRVFKRHALEGTTVERNVKGKITSSIMKLTPANLEVIIEAQKIFPLWDKYIAAARKSGAFLKPEENEDE